jgi:hypothetical protein
MTQHKNRFSLFTSKTGKVKNIASNIKRVFHFSQQRLFKLFFTRINTEQVTLEVHRELLAGHAKNVSYFFSILIMTGFGERI